MADEYGRLTPEDLERQGFTTSLPSPTGFLENFLKSSPPVQSKPIKTPEQIRADRRTAYEAFDPFLGGVGAGVTRGALGVAEGVFGAGEVVSKLIPGGKHVRPFFKWAGDKTSEINASIPSYVPSFTDIESIGDLGQYSSEKIGEMLGFMAPSVVLAVVTGGLSVEAQAGVAAKTIAQKIYQKMLPRLVAGSFVPETGLAYREIRDETGKEAPFTAIGAGAINAALEALPEAGLMKRLLSSAPDIKIKGLKAYMANVLKEAGRYGMIEGLTEGGQETVNILADKFASSAYDAVNENNLIRVTDAFLAGLMGGGVLGGAGGAVSPFLAATQPEDPLNRFSPADIVAKAEADRIMEMASGRAPAQLFGNPFASPEPSPIDFIIQQAKTEVSGQAQVAAQEAAVTAVVGGQINEQIAANPSVVAKPPEMPPQAAPPVAPVVPPPQAPLVIPPPVQPTPARETWEMTQSEALGDMFRLYGAESTEYARGRHYSDVFDALLAGKPVPGEVLSDYPKIQELVKKHKDTQAAIVPPVVEPPVPLPVPVPPVIEPPVPLPAPQLPPKLPPEKSNYKKAEAKKIERLVAGWINSISRADEETIEQIDNEASLVLTRSVKMVPAAIWEKARDDVVSAIASRRAMIKPEATDILIDTRGRTVTASVEYDAKTKTIKVKAGGKTIYTSTQKFKSLKSFIDNRDDALRDPSIWKRATKADAWFASDSPHGAASDAGFEGEWIASAVNLLRESNGNLAEVVDQLMSTKAISAKAMLNVVGRAHGEGGIATKAGQGVRPSRLTPSEFAKRLPEAIRALIKSELRTVTDESEIRQLEDAGSWDSEALTGWFLRTAEEGQPASLGSTPDKVERDAETGVDGGTVEPGPMVTASERAVTIADAIFQATGSEEAAGMAYDAMRDGSTDRAEFIAKLSEARQEYSKASPEAATAWAANIYDLIDESRQGGQFFGSLKRGVDHNPQTTAENPIPMAVAVGPDEIRKLVNDQRLGFAPWIINFTNLFMEEVDPIYWSQLTLQVVSFIDVKGIAGVEYEGTFAPLLRLAKVAVNSQSPDVIAHEMAHSLYDFLPEQLRLDVNNEWKQELQAAINRETDPGRIKFLQSILESGGIRASVRDSIGEPVEIVSKEGVKYLVMFDGFQDFTYSGKGMVAQFTPLEDIPGIKPKGSTTYAFVLKNAGFTVPEFDERGMVQAYHGTPHAVNKFSTEKVGTGEGAQVYGWGIYFAENPEVAKTYTAAGVSRDFSPRDTVEFSPSLRGRAPLSGEVAFTGYRVKHSGTNFWKYYFKTVLGKDSNGDFPNRNQGYRVDEKDVPIGIKDFSQQSVSFGNEYTVQLDVEPKELLDWDKPLDSRTLSAVSEVIADRNKRFGDIPSPERLTGRDLYRILSNHFSRPAGTLKWTEGTSLSVGDVMISSDKAASEYLASLGIKGIRYADQGSRGLSAEKFIKPTSDGRMWSVYDTANDKVLMFDNYAAAEKFFNENNLTYNYVIFDDKLISITHENGKPVTAAEKTEYLKGQQENQPEGGQQEVFGSPRRITDRQNEIIRNYAEAANAVLSLTSYGQRDWTATGKVFLAFWSNSGNAWFTGMGGRRLKGDGKKLDANVVPITARSLRDAQLIADNLPPLPLAVNSTENNPLFKEWEMTEERIQEIEDFYEQWDSTFESGVKVSKDAVPYIDKFMDKIRSPEQKFTDPMGRLKTPSDLAKYYHLTHPEEYFVHKLLQKTNPDSVWGYVKDLIRQLANVFKRLVGLPTSGELWDSIHAGFLNGTFEPNYDQWNSSERAKPGLFGSIARTKEGLARNIASEATLAGAEKQVVSAAAQNSLAARVMDRIADRITAGGGFVGQMARRFSGASHANEVVAAASAYIDPKTYLESMANPSLTEEVKAVISQDVAKFWRMKELKLERMEARGKKWEEDFKGPSWQKKLEKLSDIKAKLDLHRQEVTKRLLTIIASAVAYNQKSLKDSSIAEGRSGELMREIAAMELFKKESPGLGQMITNMIGIISLDPEGRASLMGEAAITPEEILRAYENVAGPTAYAREIESLSIQDDDFYKDPARIKKLLGAAQSMVNQRRNFFQDAARFIAKMHDLSRDLLTVELLATDGDAYVDYTTNFGTKFLKELQNDPAGFARRRVMQAVNSGTKEGMMVQAFITLNKTIERAMNLYSANGVAIEIARETLKDPLIMESYKTALDRLGSETPPISIKGDVRGSDVPIDDVGVMTARLPGGREIRINLNVARDLLPQEQRKLEDAISAIHSYIATEEGQSDPYRRFWELRLNTLAGVWNSDVVFGYNPPAEFAKGGWGILDRLLKGIGGVAANKALVDAGNLNSSADKIGNWMRTKSWNNILLLHDAAKSHPEIWLSGKSKAEAIIDWYDIVGNAYFGKANSMGIVMRVGEEVIPGTVITEEDRKALINGSEIINDLYAIVPAKERGLLMATPTLEDRFGKNPEAVLFRKPIRTTPYMMPRVFRRRAIEFSRLIHSITEGSSPDKWSADQKKRVLAEVNINFHDFFRAFLEDRGKFAGGEFSPRAYSEALASLVSGRANKVEDLVNIFSADEIAVEWTPAQVMTQILGETITQVEHIYRETAEADPKNDMVWLAQHNSFTSSRKEPIANYWFYDYGMKDNAAILNLAADALDFQFQRLRESLVVLNSQLLLEITTIRSRNKPPRKMSGEDSGNLKDLHTRQKALHRLIEQMNEAHGLTGRNAAMDWHLGRRSLGILVGAAIGNPVTATINLIGSYIRVGLQYQAIFGLRTINPSWAIAYGKEIVKAAALVGRGLAKAPGAGIQAYAKGRKLAPALLAAMDEVVNQTWVKDLAMGQWNASQRYQEMASYGWFPFVSMDRMRGMAKLSDTGGAIYAPKYSSIKPVEKLQRLANSGVTFIGLILSELPNTVFPRFGDLASNAGAMGVAEVMAQNMKLEAARTFESMGVEAISSQFNLNNPKDVTNIVHPQMVLGRWSSNNNLSIAQEMFRGAGIGLNEEVVAYWKRLSEVEPSKRPDVEFISSEKLGELGKILAEEINKPSKTNRPTILSTHGLARTMVPLTGWSWAAARHSIRWFGRARYSGKDETVQQLRVLQAIMVAGLLASATMGALGQEELLRRIYKWLLGEERPGRQPWETDTSWEATKRAILAASTIAPVLNIIPNIMFNDTPAAASVGMDLFVQNKVKDMLGYVSGVINTGDPTYRLPDFANRTFPFLRPFVNKLPGYAGVIDLRNQTRLITRYAPEDLRRQASLSSSFASTATELTPYGRRMVNAAMNGDYEELASIYQEAIVKATELGRADPDKVVKQLYAAQNPARVALKAQPTEEQWATILAKMPSEERTRFMEAIGRYEAGAAAIGVNTEVVKGASLQTPSISSLQPAQLQSGQSLYSPAGGTGLSVSPYGAFPRTRRLSPSRGARGSRLRSRSPRLTGRAYRRRISPGRVRAGRGLRLGSFRLSGSGRRGLRL